MIDFLCRKTSLLPKDKRVDGGLYTGVDKMLVTYLEYADNMALLADNWVDLTTMLDSLATTCKKLGLTISCKKTETLAVLTNPGAQSPAPVQLVPGSDPIEVVPHFQYLGSTIQNDCVMDVRSVPRCARPHLHSIHCPAFCDVSRRSRPVSRFAS